MCMLIYRADGLVHAVEQGALIHGDQLVDEGFNDFGAVVAHKVQVVLIGVLLELLHELAARCVRLQLALVASGDRLLEVRLTE